MNEQLTITVTGPDAELVAATLRKLLDLVARDGSYGFHVVAEDRRVA